MADSAVPISAGTGTQIDTRTAGNGDHRQVMVPGGDGDYVAGVTPYGYLRVNGDATGLFYDAFNGTVLDTTDRWTLVGPTPGMPTGWLQMSTTASTNTSLQSKAAMVVQTSAYLNQSTVVQLEATTAATGAGRFWGLGMPAATPSSTALVTDGAGWEVAASDGALLAVTYAAGVRTIQATITPGTALSTGTVPNFRDGNFHRFSIIYRQSRIYWYVDGFDAHVATVAYPNLGGTQDLSILIVRNNAASYTGTPVFNVMAVGCGDMSRNGVQLSDGTFNWRKAKVDASGALSVNIVESSGVITPTIAALTTTGVPTAGAVTTTGQAVLNVSAAGNVTISVNTTSLSSTVNFEATDDSGTTWYPISAIREDATGADQNFTMAGAALSRLWTTGVPGFTHVRVRLSGFLSGTLNVRMTAGPMLIETQPSLGASTSVIGTTRDYMASATAGRVLFTASAAAVALTAAEAMVTLIPARAASSGTGATSLTITGGKILRLQGWSLTLVGSATATATAASARLRFANTTTTTTASTVIDSLAVNLAAIASNRGGAVSELGADGVELPAGYSFGVSISGIASGTFDIAVHGYEYA